MNKMIAESIKNQSRHTLHLIAEDCEKRIGSHVAGGDVNENYVESQRAILKAIQDELSKRK